ncbi:MAG: pirin family protein [Sulfuricurvum sp.]|uniref:pirin family protein n=1 Tax=Sulfuricurvum sp. TaxID=2025608 RepID=UPI00272254CB|nr:pirin family protein [Sulfuricurvum sp.]MDO9055893.1 pirin family protein [Sulfuricurvum sp.]
MKISLHRAGKRGISDKDSFIRHDDANHCEQNRFGALCFLNETEIEPLGSCEFHLHRDTEIITIVTQGSLEHKDMDGSHGVIGAGHIQYMSAENNFRLLEHNPSPIEKTELLQLWIIPRQKNSIPRYEQRSCDMDRFNRWALIISGNGRKNSLQIEQDVSIRVSHLFMGHTLVSDPMKPGYGRLLFVLDGEVNACGHILKRRDELQILGDETFEITANRDAHLFLFDVPMAHFE